MSRFLAVLLALALYPVRPHAQPAGEGSAVELNLADAPLSQAAGLYAELSKCAVKIEPGRYPTTTLRVETRVTRLEAIQLIEGVWRSNGIVVVKRVLPCKVFLFPDAASVPAELLESAPSAPSGGLERRVIRKPWERPGVPSDT